MSIPKDPYILLSFINTKLRDEYSDLDELCSSLDIDCNYLVNVLSSIEYNYKKDVNRFIPMVS